MRTGNLQMRFLLAGCLLVATTLLIGLWSALTFARLSAAAADAMRTNQSKIDLTAAMAGSLEREDDALLLALSGDVANAKRTLTTERTRGDEFYRRLDAADELSPREVELLHELRQDMDRYREAGAELMRRAGSADALERYHKQVNPLLRQAVAACGRIREESFSATRQAGLHVHDVADRATWAVFGVSVAAILLATVVSVWLARSVLRPVRSLTEAVQSIRAGDFDRRVPPASTEELGRLTDGFNRMAQTLGEYRRSSLGELLTAKHTLEATLNALPDAVLVVGPEGDLAALNPPARELLEAWGCSGASRLAELPLRPEHREAVEAALSGRPGVPSRTDFALALTATRGGLTRRFMLKAVPIPEFAPRRFGVVIVLDDVTEFARLDELRGELIGVASHELKTPLTTLRMNLLLLGENTSALSARQREMLNAALTGCEELGGTIDELLDVTRIEAGKLRLDLAPVDIEPILHQVLRHLGPRFEDAGVKLRIEKDGSAGQVRGDASRLGIVLSNLLTNALKYSPPGGVVTIQLSTRSKVGESGQPMLQVAVIDQGPGIPAALRERVFEKFFRVEHHVGADSNEVRGTGIGLYLCREIVKAHSGFIRIESGEGGVGTKVALLLPATA